MATRKVSRSRVAIALSAAAIGSVALLPMASASVSEGAFQIRSYNAAEPSIQSIAGMDGRGSTGTPPEAPESCGWDGSIAVTAPSEFRQAWSEDGNTYFSPKESDGWTDSSWVDDVIESGGTITAGAPTVNIPQVSLRNGEEYSSQENQPFPELLPHLGTLDAPVAGGTVALYSGSQEGVLRFTAPFPEYHTSEPDGVSVWNLANTASFYERYGLDVTNEDHSATPSQVEITYPLSVHWPETAERGCQQQTVDLTVTINSVQ